MRVPLPGMLGVLAALVIPASGPHDGASRAPGDSTVVVAPEPPRDSLVLSGHDLNVWFTLAREDRAADGAHCVDRAIEIRRGRARVIVPLLYTEEAPTVVDDTTLEAVLYRGCRPIDRYRVYTRTGQPTPVRGT